MNPGDVVHLEIRDPEPAVPLRVYIVALFDNLGVLAEPYGNGGVSFANAFSRNFLEFRCGFGRRKTGDLEVLEFAVYFPTLVR